MSASIGFATVSGPVADAAPHDYRHALLHEWFERQADRTPDRPAVGFEGRWLTYRELDERANCLAWWLRDHGVGPEVVVGLCLDRSLDMMIGVLGVLKAGGAYLPMDPTLPQTRLNYIVADAGAAMVLVDRKSASVFGGHEVLPLDEPLPEPPTGRHGRPGRIANADNLAYMIYTSGSTGTPKGVVMSHRGIQRIAGDLVDVVVGQGAFPSVVTLNAPIFFDGSIKQICWMAGGASMVIVPDDARQDPEVLFELMLAERVDLLDCTPALLEMFSLLVGIDALPTGMRVLIGGEAISPRLWNELRGSGLEAYNLYGPTESNAITAIRVAESAEPVIGRPLPGYVVRIVDESGAPAPVGAVGELVATGAGIARGYRNRPGLTAQRFVGAIESAPGQRSYRTGDLGRRRADGLIEFLGRRDSQVKLRGYRIELAEVEAAVARMPGVSACAVVLRETPAGDKRLVSYVVATSSVPEADMIDELRAELPDYMVPARVVRMELLPLTRNGKIDRAALS